MGSICCTGPVMHRPCQASELHLRAETRSKAAMLLWKNIIVLSALMSIAWALARALAASRLDTKQLAWLSVVGWANLALLLTTVPYMFLLSVLAVSFLVLWQLRVPPLLSFLYLVTILPLMTYRFGEVGPIKTFIVINVMMLGGAAVLILKLLRPGMFKTLRFGWLDLAVLLFILLYVLLSTRLIPLTTMIRQCVENLIIYGGAYFAASRFPLERPRLTLLGMLMVALFLACVSTFEAVMHWPLFEDTRDMFKRPGFGVRFGLFRSVGPNSDPLAFSLMQAYFAVSAIGLWMLSKRRDLILLIGSILAVGILVTGARTGILGMGAALTTFAVMRGRAVLAVGLLVIIGAGVMQSAAFEGDQHLAETADYRLRLLYEVPARMAGDLWIGDPEATEVGGQLWDLRQGQGIVDLVNSYLQLFVNGGIILLAAFLVLIAFAFISYSKVQRLSNVSRDTEAIITVSVLQLIVMVAGLFVTSLTDKNLFFVIISIGMISGLHRSCEARKGIKAFVVWSSAAAPRSENRSTPQPGALS